MTSAEAVLRGRASRRNALVRKLYLEFPRLPADAVANAVLLAWEDLLLAPEGSGASREEVVERLARERLRESQHRAELARARVGLGQDYAGMQHDHAESWRHSA